MFLYPRSRLKNWSRETGSAVPFRVGPLILYTRAEFGAYLRESSRFPRRRPFIYTVNRHRVSPEFMKSRICVPMASTAESPPARTGPPVVLKCNSSNGHCLSGIIWPNFRMPLLSDTTYVKKKGPVVFLCQRFVT